MGRLSSMVFKSEKEQKDYEKYMSLKGQFLHL